MAEKQPAPSEGIGKTLGGCLSTIGALVVFFGIKGCIKEMGKDRRHKQFEFLEQKQPEPKIPIKLVAFKKWKNE